MYHFDSSPSMKLTVPSSSAIPITDLPPAFAPINGSSKSANILFVDRGRREAHDSSKPMRKEERNLDEIVKKGFERRDLRYSRREFANEGASTLAIHYASAFHIRCRSDRGSGTHFVQHPLEILIPFSVPL